MSDETRDDLIIGGLLKHPHNRIGFRLSFLDTGVASDMKARLQELFSDMGFHVVSEKRYYDKKQ